jgi:plastocyanin
MKLMPLTFGAATTAIAISTLFLSSACNGHTTTSNHNSPATEIAQAPVSNATVTIENFQFKSNNIVIKKGGKVTFINQDSTPHTATPEGGAKFTGTGRLAKGQSKTVVFNTVGIQNYFCEIHPSMKGKITVVD